jgi:hypothetical protein
MKKILFIAGASIFFFSLTSTAQQTQIVKRSNPTGDSITAKYKLAPMPSQLSIDQIFPVIGTYQSNANANQKIIVTLDETNKGFVWIDGMPQGKIKAILKQSPGVYKIPMQNTSEGKAVPEGTLVYNADTKTLDILIGRAFNDVNPLSVFTTNSTDDQSKIVITKTRNGKIVKQKVKNFEPIVFTGTKIDHTTAAN